MVFNIYLENMLASESMSILGQTFSFIKDLSVLELNSII